MYYIGIDPGASGGIAILSEAGAIVDYSKLPTTHRGFLDWVRSRLTWFGNDRNHEAGRAVGVIEHVWSIPGQGGAFAFGKSVGALQMGLTALDVRFELILPKKWQRIMGVSYRAGMTDVEKKNITKRRAQSLFPSVKVTHATADALLLAEYCRRAQRAHGSQEEESRTEAGVEVVAQGESGRQRAIRKRVAQAQENIRQRAVGGPAGHGRRAQHPAQ